MSKQLYYRFREIIIIIILFSEILYSQGHIFSTFSTGTITGGDPAYTKLLDVSGLTDNYLFYVVTADFVPGAKPPYSNTIEMALNNGSNTTYKISSVAGLGASASSSNTTLIWSGIMRQLYNGGDNLAIEFKDTYTDVGGPYTSYLNNVTVKIYENPTPVKSFTTFSTGEITGGDPAYTKLLDVSGLTDDYLFYVVTADFVGGTDPAYSNTIEMSLNNGSGTIYQISSIAGLGASASSSNTTLIWSGIMRQVYSGGDNLTIEFKDTYSDGGGPYTSYLNNVLIKISPHPIYNKTFNTFSTGTITGGDPAYTKLLDVSGLTDDYLFYVVTADFVGGTDPAYSNTIEMSLNNGSGTIYQISSIAGLGASASSSNTTLIWSGIMRQVYSGGDNLTIEFKDTYSDGGGPYTSYLNNVDVSIYPVPSSSPVPVELLNFSAVLSENSIKLSWQTATEVNNYGFEIERTKILEKSDIEVWEKIGFVPGSGNSNSPKLYEYWDETAPINLIEYRLKQIDTDGKFKYYNLVAKIDNSITKVADEEIPIEFSLNQNYPNPFNPTTKIKYAIPNTFSENVLVELKVFNLLGKEVVVLVNRELTSGYYDVSFNAGSLPSGIYFYKLKVGSEYLAIKKMMLIK